MRKLALCAIAGLVLAVPATAQAGGGGDGGYGGDHYGNHTGGHHGGGGGGQPGCMLNQVDCRDIVITREPPGGNCPTGGIRIIVGRSSVFYVCNGTPGAPGLQGPPGQPGQNGLTPVIVAEPAGANCVTGGIRITVGNGTPFYICNGAAGPTGPAGPPGSQGPAGTPGAAGPAGPAGPRGPAGPAAPTCASSRVATWTLIVARHHRIRGLRAYFEGVRTRFRTSTVRGRPAYLVRIDLRGLPRGVYGGRIFYRASVNGRAFRRLTEVHLFRTCYGNPKGGQPTGLNRFPFTRI